LTSGTNPLAQSGTISIEYVVPATSPSQHARSPRYVSASTYQAVLVIKPQNQSPLQPQIIQCTAGATGGKVCSGSLDAPPGVDSITITLEDQPAAGSTRGNALSQGVVVAVVNAGQNTDIRATLDGIVHDVALKFAAPNVPYAPALPYDASSQGRLTVPTYVVVNALDADGNIITYNGAYIDSAGNNVAVKLTPSSLCGGNAKCSIAMGATTIAGPGAVVPVTATLDDSASAFQETLTVTPSILFGNPGGALSADSTSFSRPSSCSAYVPAYLPADFSVSVGPSGTFTLLSYSLTWVFTSDPRYAMALDPRLAFSVELTITVPGDVLDLGYVYPPFGGASGGFLQPLNAAPNGISANASNPWKYGLSFAYADSNDFPNGGSVQVAIFGDGKLCGGATTGQYFLPGVSVHWGS
jgi:hypothetical protein